MGYLFKAIVGGALFLGGVVLFNYELVTLVEAVPEGSCASGNTPYAIENPCPEGIGTHVLLMMAGIFGGLIGAALFAFRGASPWGGRRRMGGFFGFGTFAWGFFFTATGATALISSFANEIIRDSPGGHLGLLIVGITFLVMGLPALAISLWGFVRSFLSGEHDERPPRAVPSGGSTLEKMRAGLASASGAQQIGQRMGWSTARSGGSRSGGDTIGRIERLQKLKESGAITKGEFDKEKAKILAEQ